MLKHGLSSKVICSGGEVLRLGLIIKDSLLFDLNLKEFPSESFCFLVHLLSLNSGSGCNWWQLKQARVCASDS